MVHATNSTSADTTVGFNVKEQNIFCSKKLKILGRWRGGGVINNPLEGKFKKGGGTN